MSEPRSARLLRNVLWNFGGQGAALVVNLFATPYLVAALGLGGYALYVVLNSAVNMLAILSLGSGAAVVKHVAERKSYAWAAVRYGAVFHVGGALLGAALLWWLAEPAARSLFSIGEQQLADCVFVLRCAAVAAVFSALLQLGASALQGLQRFDWHNGIAAAAAVAIPAGVVAAVYFGAGIRGAAVWYAAATALAALAALGAAAARLPSEPGETLRFGTFAGYSLSMALGPVAWLFIYQLDKMFIAAVLPLAQLPLYAVPSGLLQRIQTIPASIASVMVPMMSEQQEDLRRFYLRSFRLVAFLTLPWLALLFAFMPQLLTLWVGGDFGGSSVWVGRFLVVGQAAIALTYVPSAAAAGRGRPLFLSGLAWAQALLSVAAWAVLARPYGILGVALGACIGQAVPAVAYVVLVNRRVLGLGLGRLLAEGLAAPAAAALLLLTAGLATHHWASNWPRMIAFGAAGLALYAAAGWKLALPEDRQSVRDYL